MAKPDPSSVAALNAAASLVVANAGGALVSPRPILRRMERNPKHEHRKQFRLRSIRACGLLRFRISPFGFQCGGCSLLLTTRKNRLNRCINPSHDSDANFANSI